MKTKQKLTPLGKLTIIALVIGAILIFKYYVFDALPQDAKESTVIGKLKLPDEPNASFNTEAMQLALPTNKASKNDGTKISWKIMAWNSQFALMYANGGAETKTGSLIEKANLQVELIRQDDCNKTIADLVKFANDYKSNPSTDAVFASFMGDGMPAFFAALCKELAPLGADYQPIAFYAMGKSYGEDQLMGPMEWKRNPQLAKGKTVACVMRDGDMNILLKWAGDNGIKVNPDETTFDGNAINLIAANDFLDAPNKYITGYKEKRRFIVNNKKIARDTTVGVDAVATWTPGDVNVANQKGGLVTIASTKQYSTQMPNITITIKKFAYDHRTDMENLIVALSQAGDQVRSFKVAKSLAAKVSAIVYNEQNPEYWLKYYNGIEEKDVQGLKVQLGGSMVFNLNDAANMFGLGKDGIDRYKAVYNTFGDILSKMYPELLKDYPKYQSVVDKSFLQSVVANHTELMEGQALKNEYSQEITSEVSSKSYEIQFESGSSVIKSQSYKMLNEILESAIVAEGLKIGVYGHTDNTGSASANIKLSVERANSVKKYLISKGILSERIESKGFGQEKPIADNSTHDGQAKNRRVQIVLGE